MEIEGGCGGAGKSRSGLHTSVLLSRQSGSTQGPQNGARRKSWRSCPLQACYSSEHRSRPILACTRAPTTRTNNSTQQHTSAARSRPAAPHVHPVPAAAATQQAESQGLVAPLYAQSQAQEGLGCLRGPIQRSAASQSTPRSLMCSAFFSCSRGQRGPSCLWQTPQGESQIRECPDLYCQCQRRALCVGIHPRGRCQVVRLPSSHSIPRTNRFSSGLYLKENG